VLTLRNVPLGRKRSLGYDRKPDITIVADQLAGRTSAMVDCRYCWRLD
jgi:hypothetical protein